MPMATKKKQKKVVKKAAKPVKVVKKTDKDEDLEIEEPKRATPGVYVYKPLKSKIVECDCGNKYIVTRPRQKTCLDCVKAEMLTAR